MPTALRDSIKDNLSSVLQDLQDYQTAEECYDYIQEAIAYIDTLEAENRRLASQLKKKHRELMTLQQSYTDQSFERDLND